MASMQELTSSRSHLPQRLDPVGENSRYSLPKSLFREPEMRLIDLAGKFSSTRWRFANSSPTQLQQLHVQWCARSRDAQLSRRSLRRVRERVRETKSPAR